MLFSLSEDMLIHRLFSRIMLVWYSQTYSWIKSSQPPILTRLVLVILYSILCKLLFSVMSHTILANHLTGMATLTWSNYKKRKIDIELILGKMDLDSTLLVPSLNASKENYSPDVVAKFEKWERTSRWSLMTIK